MDALKHFHFIHIDNHAPKTLFLLHGTGGDEKDLLPLVDFAAARYNLVGLKGNISEHGMARFFRRQGAGVFDQENIKEETQKLCEFLKAWYNHHHTSARDVVFVGYSNGANMILATLFNTPALISKGVILHGMLPFEPGNVDLSGKSFLVTYGEQDQMIDPAEGKKVATTLKEHHAEVLEVSHEGGHEIRSQELTGLETFLMTA